MSQEPFEDLIRWLRECVARIWFPEVPRELVIKFESGKKIVMPLCAPPPPSGQPEEKKQPPGLCDRAQETGHVPAARFDLVVRAATGLFYSLTATPPRPMVWSVAPCHSTDPSACLFFARNQGHAVSHPNFRSSEVSHGVPIRVPSHELREA
jgi:hypothetical protein